ncbi:MAG TPA: hypothetical protein VFB99_06455 [Vicinamibacterales bacterium]|nr:hypothetical protein [Vicinamibacterales bacterium]
MFDLAELLPCKIRQFVGVAVPAGQRVPQQGEGQVTWHLRKRGDKTAVIRLGGHRDNRVMPEAIGAMRERHATDMVPMAVDEVLGRKAIAERQGFEKHSVVAVGMQLRLGSNDAVPLTS